MEITQNDKLTILTAATGFTLTQSAPVDLQDRIFSKKLYLGKYDKPENYIEISDSEAENLTKELEQLRIAEENPQNIED
jgi:hypothetical protein